MPILVNGIALPPCTVYIGHHRLPHNQKVTGQKTCRNRNKKYIVTMNRQIAKRSQAKKHVNTGITNTLVTIDCHKIKGSQAKIYRYRNYEYIGYHELPHNQKVIGKNTRYTNIHKFELLSRLVLECSNLAIISFLRNVKNAPRKCLKYFKVDRDIVKRLDQLGVHRCLVHRTPRPKACIHLGYLIVKQSYCTNKCFAKCIKGS